MSNNSPTDIPTNTPTNAPPSLFDSFYNKLTIANITGILNLVILLILVSIIFKLSNNEAKILSIFNKKL